MKSEVDSAATLSKLPASIFKKLYDLHLIGQSKREKEVVDNEL